ncbi:MAG: MFS transporter [Desulfuromonadales bacterium]|nr:MFS transporter [Desulfuromonadales bacterium]
MRLHLLRAFGSRNFRLFFAGQSVSLVGTWMQQVAVAWLVYRLTGSAVLLGVVSFAGQIPAFFCSPLAGVFADRWNRRRLLLWTQGLAMVQATLLASFVFAGTIQVWHLVVFNALLGIINAFDIPVRQSLVVEMVDKKEDLPNAIALNSSMVNSARLIGPSLAGILIAAVGEEICFLINAVSYLAVLLAIGAMRLAPAAPRQNRKHVLLELRAGFGYAFGFTPIRAILLLIALVGLVGMPYSVLLPVFAREVLHGGAETFGFLMTAAGLGALASTIFLASRRSVVGLGRVMVIATALFGLGLIGLAFSRLLPLSLAFIALGGFGAMALIASSNTIIQTIVEDEMRGRVMSLFTMAFLGMTPLGSLAAGALADSIGPTTTLVAGGFSCLAAAAVFASRLPTLRQLVHPIYVRMGIIPEVAKGLQTASDLFVPPEKP